MNNVLVSIQDKVATLAINRAEARNALNAATLTELIESLRELKKCDAHALVFRGVGDQAFCAGADLKELISLKPKKRGEFFKDIAKVVTLMRELPLPIIAQVHGFALAGGMGLVAASDIAVATDDAKFGLPEIAIGLVPMIVSIPLERTIGLRALSELMLSGEFIDANRAREIGLITRVVTKEAINNEVAQITSKLAARSRKAIIGAKKALRDVTEKNFGVLMREFSKHVAALSAGKDFEVCVNRFLEKQGKK